MLIHAEKSNQEKNQSTKDEITSAENFVDISYEYTYNNEKTRQLKKSKKMPMIEAE